MSEENQKMNFSVVWVGSITEKNHLKLLHIKENRLGNTFADNTRVNACIIFYEGPSNKENVVSNQYVNEEKK